MTFDDAILPLLSAVAGFGAAAATFGMAWQSIKSKVDAIGVTSTSEQLRMKVLEDDRFQRQFEAGAVAQRIKVLEEGQPNHRTEIATVESRLRTEMAGMENRITDHFDRAVDIFKEREDTGARKLSDLEGADRDRHGLPKTPRTRAR